MCIKQIANKNNENFIPVCFLDKYPAASLKNNVNILYLQPDIYLYFTEYCSEKSAVNEKQ